MVIKTHAPPCTAPRAFRFNRLAPVPTAAGFLLELFDRRWEVLLFVVVAAVPDAERSFLAFPFGWVSFFVAAAVAFVGTAGGDGKSLSVVSLFLSLFSIVSGAVPVSEAAAG